MHQEVDELGFFKYMSQKGKFGKEKEKENIIMFYSSSSLLIFSSLLFLGLRL